MSFELLDAVKRLCPRTNNITPTEREVLAQLAFHRNHQNGQTNPSIDVLVAGTGRSRATVIRVLKSMQTKGWIAVPFHGGGRLSNHYALDEEMILNGATFLKSRRAHTAAVKSHSETAAISPRDPSSIMVRPEPGRDLGIQPGRRVGTSSRDDGLPPASPLFTDHDSLEELGIEDENGRDVMDLIQEVTEGFDAKGEILRLMNTSFIGRRIDSIAASHVWASYREVERFLDAEAAVGSSVVSYPPRTECIRSRNPSHCTGNSRLRMLKGI
jgi:helix-turn-helix protein